MAGSPRYKVHNPQGEYIASCKHIEDAGLLANSYGRGAKIKDAHWGRVVFESDTTEDLDDIVEHVRNLHRKWSAEYAKKHNITL